MRTATVRLRDESIAAKSGNQALSRQVFGPDPREEAAGGSLQAWASSRNSQNLFLSL